MTITQPNLARMRYSLIMLLSIMCYHTQAQTVVNAYYKVTAIATDAKTLTISTSSGHQSEPSGGRVQAGDICILMQMQDDVIGDQTNSASFGSLGAIKNAGVSEEVEVMSVEGTPINKIILKGLLKRSFSINANASVQLISFKKTTSFVTSSDLTALAWNGDIGGVLALHDATSITLGHNLSANGQGFRGGAVNSTQAQKTCNPSMFITSDAELPQKGAGIYKSTTLDHANGRGKILNGGGGGNHVNAGGGGGGNRTAGGEGGPGWDNKAIRGCAPVTGGLGGLDLSEHISVGRFFMGGGGGGGQGNNSVATPGGHGGGIIIIKAPDIIVQQCVTISANGANVTGGGNDGGGGGGGGGAVIFPQEVSWTFNCELTIQARGGKGGAVTGTTSTHGGGGGGGRGVILYSGPRLSMNNPSAKDITTDTSPGEGGANSTDSASGVAASGATNPNNNADEGVLPVRLLYWKATPEQGQVRLAWGTASEVNNHYYTLHRSADGLQWKQLATQEGQGTTSAVSHYRYTDSTPLAGVNYYRLSQTDYDGTTETFHVVSARPERIEGTWQVYPNPTSGLLHLVLPDGSGEALPQVTFFDMAGRQGKPSVKIEQGKATADMQGLKAGIYLVRVAWGNAVQTFRVQYCP